MKPTKRMEEMVLCLTQQGLNEIPWGITLEEYLKLRKIILDDRRKKKR